jgi:hypothetical protein
MKKHSYKLLLLLFLFANTHKLFAQFNGGSNDGFNVAAYSKQSFTDANAFRGGSNDGVNVAVYNKQSFTDVAAFKGGNNDGFNVAAYSKQSFTDANAFKGGSNDGFTTAVYNKQSFTDANAFKGGSNDGFNVAIYNKQSFTDALAFKGGNGRGETQTIYRVPFCNGIGIRIWNGSVSTAWGNPNNWDCGILPVINSEVIIPAGVPRYPSVNLNFEIKKLTINPNASINILPGINFKLNGF